MPDLCNFTGNINAKQCAGWTCTVAVTYAYYTDVLNGRTV